MGRGTTVSVSFFGEGGCLEKKQNRKIAPSILFKAMLRAGVKGDLRVKKFPMYSKEFKEFQFKKKPIRNRLPSL